MDKTIFSSIQRLSPEQIQQADTLFFELLGNVEEKEMLLDSLHTLLLGYSHIRLEELKDSYLRWYAIVAWDRSITLNRDTFMRVLDTTLVIAVKEDIPIWKLIVGYLHGNSLDQEDMVLLYQKTRTTCLDSEQIIARIKSTPLTFATFVETLSQYDLANDTLGIAQFVSEIEFEMSRERKEWQASFDAKKAVASLRDLVHFFEGIVSDNIVYVVDAYMYPQRYTQTSEQPVVSDEQAIPADMFSDVGSATLAEEQEEQTDIFFNTLSPHQADFSSWISTDAARRELLANVQSEQDPIVARMLLAGALQQLFPNIHEDMNTAGAIVELDNYLQSQGLTAEHDFLYFDDTDAGFHWHSSYLQ